MQNTLLQPEYEFIFRKYDSLSDMSITKKHVICFKTRGFKHNS